MIENIIWYSILLFFLFHYLFTITTQSINLSYFGSFEWKSAWQDNNCSRMAGEHKLLIKKGLLGCLMVMLLYLIIYYYNPFKFFVPNIALISSELWYDHIINGWYFAFSQYMFFGFSLFFWGMIIYFLLYPKYPLYTMGNTPLNISPFNLINHRSTVTRETFFYTVVLGLIYSYILLNVSSQIIYDTVRMTRKGNPMLLMFLASLLIAYRTKFYKLYLLVFLYAILYIGFVLITPDLPSIFRAIGHAFFGIEWNYLDKVLILLAPVMRFLIYSSLIGTLLIIGSCIMTAVISMMRSKNSIDTPNQEFFRKMKPWLGFNWRFVSESSMDEQIYSFKELYDQTHPKKKLFFWIEYFFNNILNRNVVSLLQDKKTLFFKVFFNGTNVQLFKNGGRYIARPNGQIVKEYHLKKKQYIVPTREHARIEDIEGDVFTNLLSEEIPNQEPSIILPFYVTGLIYLSILPYYGLYFIAVSFFFQHLFAMPIYDIEMFNRLFYGFEWVIIMLNLGFLLSIFMNSFTIWLAWKKFYRIQDNTDALFFVLYKQRVIQQALNIYDKDENGYSVTINKVNGRYPMYDLDKLDIIAEELSPKYYSLFRAKFPVPTTKL